MSDLDLPESATPLNMIYFYLTEGCNLKCRHCWVAPKFQRDGNKYPYLPFDLFQSIISQAKPLGLSEVKLTGGEPLLHPQINQILDFIYEEKLGLCMETNGALCTPQLARAIAKCNHAHVSVSLDGANAKTHEWVRGVPGCFEAAINGLRYLVDAGLKPQVIMTLMKRNKDQIEDLINLADSLGAGSVKLNMVQPTARGEKLYLENETVSVRELIDLGRWTEEVLSKKTKLKIFSHYPMAFRSLNNLFGCDGNGCGRCFIKRILGVLANGSYALCGIGESVPDLVFGNARTDRLEKIWKDSPILVEIREGMPGKLKGICSDCIFKNICRGSCIAQNYYRSKDLWAPYWFCDEAQKEGTFPENRCIIRS